MKRYRVWEANRKIFLFPENWLEPEFRDDKTHLFTGARRHAAAGRRVSDDAVEDAFLDYLQRLEEIARLDIVAMHLRGRAPIRRCEHAARRRAHLRRAAPVLLPPLRARDVDAVGAGHRRRSTGDHSRPSYWRDRLYLFWVTFNRADAIPAAASTPESKFEAVSQRWPITNVSPYSPLGKPEDTSAKNLTEVSGADLASDVRSARPARIVEAHMHWSEFTAGTGARASPAASTFALRVVDQRPARPQSVLDPRCRRSRPDGEERWRRDPSRRGYQPGVLSRGPQQRARAGRPTRKPTANPLQRRPPCRPTRYPASGALRVT